MLIRNKLSRKMTVALVAVAMPVLAAAGLAIVAHETDRVERMTIDRGVAAAQAGAVAYGLILEHGVATGAITADAVEHPRYQPFEYEKPTDIPRYHSGVDAYTDVAGVRELSDGILETASVGGDVIYAVGSDVGTHIPTTNSKLDHEPTGDPEVDTARSRQKRKYLDKLHINAAASLTLVVQPYLRSVGDPCWDVSAPVWVRVDARRARWAPAWPPAGTRRVHWGSFRVGISRVRIAEYKLDLALRLAALLGGAALALVAAIWLMAALHTRGLRRLTELTTRVSMGEVEAESIPRRSTPDEVGDLTDAVRRLAVSMGAAMRRLESREKEARPAATVQAAPPVAEEYDVEVTPSWRDSNVEAFRSGR